MKYQNYPLSAFLIFTIALLNGCDGKSPEYQPEYIGKAGSEFEIGFNELHGYVRTRFYDRRYPDPVEAHLRALQFLTDNQLKRMDFFERGLHLDQELLQPVRRHINEELMIELFHENFLGKYLTEEKISEAHRQMDREVHYRQIVIHKNQATNEQLSELRNKANEIRKEIESGVNFGDLVTSFSEHMHSARQGGMMNPVTWHTSRNNPVNEVVFRLNNDGVRIIETHSSLHIVQVTDVVIRPAAPLEEVRDDILQKLEEFYVEQAQEEYDRYRDSLVDESTLVWDEAAISRILEWAGRSGFFTQHYGDIFQGAAEKGHNLTILTFNERNTGKTVDLAEYQRLLDDILAMTDAPAYDRSDLKNHLLEAIKTDLIVSEALESGLLDAIFHPYSRNPTFRTRLVSIYNSHVIGGLIPDPTRENLIEFYEMVKDTAYFQLHTVNTHIIVTDDKEQARHLLQKHAEGIPFDELAHEKQVRSFYRDRDGRLHTNHRIAQPDLAAAAMELEMDFAGGPFIWHDPEHGPQYAVMKAMHIREEKQLDYSEVEDRIEEDFMTYHRENIDREIVAELREKHPVLINRSLLELKLRENGLLN
jgi:parvulin-like peptidyl-prolyl isomerase